jgi:hypothetical protein
VPPDPKLKPLSREEVSRRLTDSDWRCVKVKDFAVHSTWRTKQGFYFSVPHDCTEADFEEIMKDVRRYGRKRNVWSLPADNVGPARG